MNATNIFKKVVKKIECNDFTRTIILIGIAALTLLLIYNIGKYVGQILTDLKTTAKLTTWLNLEKN